MRGVSVSPFPERWVRYGSRPYGEGIGENPGGHVGRLRHWNLCEDSRPSIGYTVGVGNRKRTAVLVRQVNQTRKSAGNRQNVYTLSGHTKATTHVLMSKAKWYRGTSGGVEVINPICVRRSEIQRLRREGKRRVFFFRTGANELVRITLGSPLFFQKRCLPRTGQRGVRRRTLFGWRSSSVHCGVGPRRTSHVCRFEILHILSSGIPYVGLSIAVV
ncbi:hypothetical protein K439DRAFT_313124 [Ramaria rubella]|nr:hypothetical protein K439DRAFT_313124 [Ramaria rubella]